MKTKQQQKEEADKAFFVIANAAKKLYNAMVDPAWEALEARIREINAQDAQEDDGIRIIDGKKYKLIEEL